MTNMIAFHQFLAAFDLNHLAIQAETSPVGDVIDGDQITLFDFNEDELWAACDQFCQTCYTLGLLVETEEDYWSEWGDDGPEEGVTISITFSRAARPLEDGAIAYVPFVGQRLACQFHHHYNHNNPLGEITLYRPYFEGSEPRRYLGPETICVPVEMVTWQEFTPPTPPTPRLPHDARSPQGRSRVGVGDVVLVDIWHEDEQVVVTTEAVVVEASATEDRFTVLTTETGEFVTLTNADLMDDLEPAHRAVGEVIAALMARLGHGRPPRLGDSVRFVYDTPSQLQDRLAAHVGQAATVRDIITVGDDDFYRVQFAGDPTPYMLKADEIATEERIVETAQALDYDHEAVEAALEDLRRVPKFSAGDIAVTWDGFRGTVLTPDDVDGSVTVQFGTDDPVTLPADLLTRQKQHPANPPSSSFRYGRGFYDFAPDIY